MYGLKAPECFADFKEACCGDLLSYSKEMLEAAQKALKSPPDANGYHNGWLPENASNIAKTIEAIEKFWEPLTEWHHFRSAGRFFGGASGLSIQHAGDARSHTEFVFLGADISKMGDDETKNQYAESIKLRIKNVPALKDDVREDFGGMDPIEGFKWCVFTWTC